MEARPAARLMLRGSPPPSRPSHPGWRGRADSAIADPGFDPSGAYSNSHRKGTKNRVRIPLAINLHPRVQTWHRNSNRVLILQEAVVDCAEAAPVAARGCGSQVNRAYRALIARRFKSRVCSESLTSDLSGRT